MAAKDIFDKKTLNEFKKEHLVELVLELQKEKKALMIQGDTIKNLNVKVIEIERSQFLYEQYGRRESINITGIPLNIGKTKNEDLEAAVVNVYNEAGVKVHGKELTPDQISACHRIGKKGVTIVRFVNRKYAWAGLFNGKNLKGTNLYGDNQIYINNSFCREFQYYGYVIRNLKRNKLIDSYKVISGVFHIKTLGGDKYEEISHSSDFLKHKLDISAYKRDNQVA